MLVAGAVLGLILGPSVLGQFAPQVYDRLFVGSGDRSEIEAAQEAIEQFEAQSTVHLARIKSIMERYEAVGDEDDSITVARDEQINRLNEERAAERQQLDLARVRAEHEVRQRHEAHLDKLSGMATAMLLLVVLLFAAEAILSPQREEFEQGEAALPPVLARLVTVRYGLMAGWLMLMLAQPHWLRGIDPVFAGLLLLVLIAGLVPLGKKATHQ